MEDDLQAGNGYRTRATLGITNCGTDQAIIMIMLLFRTEVHQETIYKILYTKSYRVTVQGTTVPR